VLLDFLYDVLLLHLAFEAPQSVFERLSFLKPNLSQAIYTPDRYKDSATTDVATNVVIVA
jgi:hypothetical protein